MVVPQQRGLLSLEGAQVIAAGTQVDRRAERSVIDVLHPAPPVLVSVDGDGRPCRREELHRTDGVVVVHVAVEAAGVGVANPRRSVAAVESQTDDRRARHSVGVQVASARPAVPRLHLTDCREQDPVQVA